MIKDTLLKIKDEIVKNKDYLTELDRKIGDADHGNNMALGFTEFINSIDGVENNSQSMLKALGMSLMSKVGGASGPLYGMSFVKGSVELPSDKNNYSFDEFKKFISVFVSSVKALGNAKIGDKTMLDVWGNLDEKLKTETKFDESALKLFVKTEAENTKDRKALKGRASYLGERSIGTIDPGSASSAIILTHLIEEIND